MVVCVCICTFIAATAPLLSTTQCEISEWQTHPNNFASTSARDYLLGRFTEPSLAPMVGSHLAVPLAGSWLLGVMVIKRDRLWDNEVGVRRALLSYATCTVAQSMVVVAIPYLVVICPGFLERARSFTYLAAQGFYLLAQMSLFALMHLRLQAVRAEAAARRSKILWRAAAGMLFSAMISFAAWRVWPLAVFGFGTTAGAAVFLYCAFHVNVFIGLRAAAEEASREAAETGVGADSAARAMTTARTQLVASLSSALYLASTAVLNLQIARQWTSWVYEVSILLDVPSDAVLATIAADLFSNRIVCEVMSSRNFSEIGNLVEKRRARLIQEKLAAAIGAASGPALAVAALLEGVAADELVHGALQRFRCIRWRTLMQNSDIITGGGLLQAIGAGSLQLYDLSQPCRLGRCDAFLSHSWRDNGNLKMRALRTWAQDFAAEHGRGPTLWLDKVCIDQANIADDLRCLPVFLAACNSLLVTTGLTYSSRLWCALELFVYFSMVTEDGNLTPPKVIILGESEGVRARVRHAWASFEVQECDCFDDADKARILTVVNKFPGGAFGFNDYIRGLAEQALQGGLDGGHRRIFAF